MTKFVEQRYIGGFTPEDLGWNTRWSKPEPNSKRCASHFVDHYDGETVIEVVFEDYECRCTTLRRMTSMLHVGGLTIIPANNPKVKYAVDEGVEVWLPAEVFDEWYDIVIHFM